MVMKSAIFVKHVAVHRNLSTTFALINHILFGDVRLSSQCKQEKTGDLMTI